MDDGREVCMCCSSPYLGRSFKGLCPACIGGSNDPSVDAVPLEARLPGEDADVQVNDDEDENRKDHS